MKDLIPSNEGIMSVERDQNAFCTLYRSICKIKILSQINIILRADKQTMEVVWTQHHSSLDLNELHQACTIWRVTSVDREKFTKSKKFRTSLCLFNNMTRVRVSFFVRDENHVWVQLATLV